MTSLFESLSQDCDAYVVRGTGRDATFRWLTQFDVPDPSYVIVRPNETRLFVRGLELGRAQRDAQVDAVERLSDYDAPDGATGLTADAHRLSEVLSSLAVSTVSVPPTFAVGIADTLRDNGYTVTTATPVDNARVVKRPFELDALREAQAATEDTMKAVRDQLEAATIRDGELYDGETPLTADAVRRTIRSTLPATTMDVTAIVAGGTEGADPHERGSGVLPAHEPIVVDIFPRFASGYHGDMTRTFVRGEPSDAVQAMHEAVTEALDAAKSVTASDVTGDTVHTAAADMLVEHGFDGYPDADSDSGFIHSTGHGVGLDLHERPSVSTDAGALPEGAVVTLEPGLYNPDVGGLRVEDMVIVTEDGYENLNDLSYQMVL